MKKINEILIQDIFDFQRGKVISKIDIRKKEGGYPVYSSNTQNNGIFGFINTFDFNCEGITRTTDGIHAGTICYRNGKFSITNVCGLMTLKKEFLNKIYLPYIIKVLDFKSLATGSGNKKVMTNVIVGANIFIKIPVQENGEFDVEKQKEIAGKYEKLEKIKDRIRIIKEDIEEKNISLENQYHGVEKNINQLFFKRQGDAFYTKKRILENNWIGGIPVYSSNTKEEGLLVGIKKEYIRDKDLYYQNCLTWSIDGYAGKIFTRNQDNQDNQKDERYYFTINNHCGILLPKVEGLFLPFIKILLQHKFFERAKGYGNNKLGNNQIDDIEIKIPIKENGEFDIEKQKEIAEKYKKIEKMQQTLIQELEYLEKVRVEI